MSDPKLALTTYVIVFLEYCEFPIPNWFYLRIHVIVFLEYLVLIVDRLYSADKRSTNSVRSSCRIFSLSLLCPRKSECSGQTGSAHTHKQHNTTQHTHTTQHNRKKERKKTKKRRSCSSIERADRGEEFNSVYRWPESAQSLSLH